MTNQIEDWLNGGPQLERVLELKQRATMRTGVPVTLVSLEIWENSIRLVYVTTTLDPQGPTEVDEYTAWRVDDGVGTAFQTAGGGGGGDGLRMYSNMSWTPRPASSATHLRIQNEILGINVSISLAATPPPAAG